MSLSARGFPPYSLDSQASMTRPPIDDGPRTASPGFNQVAHPTRNVGVLASRSSTRQKMHGWASLVGKEQITLCQMPSWRPHHSIQLVPRQPSMRRRLPRRMEDGSCCERHHGQQNTQPCPGPPFVLIPILPDYPWIARPPVPWVHERRGQTIRFLVAALCASPGNVGKRPAFGGY